MITLFHFFSLIYPFITDNCNYGSLFWEGIKMKIFFTFKIIYPEINILFRQFRLANNLPTQIRQNTDFLLGKASKTAECQGEFRRLWLARLGKKKKAIWATQVSILNWMVVHQSSTVLQVKFLNMTVMKNLDFLNSLYSG